MKKWIIKLLVGLFAIAAVVDVAYDIIANDTIHYFTSQPQRLLLVAVIAIVGGFAVMLFDRLSPRLKRRAELLTLQFSRCSLGLFCRVVLPKNSAALEKLW